MKRRSLAFTLALSMILGLTACGGIGGAKATTMRLKKTEGTVEVSDGAGKEIKPREDLGLYSGYGVDTGAESYAWIALDSAKLAKMDQDSRIAITKEGKKLEVDVKSGSLFFNVTEPLAADESMNIRTSTMVLGIRGTCGWVTQDTAALLEGTVEVIAGGQSVRLSAGEMVTFAADGRLEVKELYAENAPAFVEVEIGESYPLEPEPAPAIPDAEGNSPAGEAEWKLEVLGKTDAQVFVGERTFTVCDWDLSFTDEDETLPISTEDAILPISTVTKTASRRYTVKNLYVMAKGDIAVITKGGEEFSGFDMTVWSDPDGDGVYDGRLIGMYDDEILPADTASPLHAGYDGEIYYTDFGLQVFSQELRVTSGLWKPPYESGTEVRLSADHLLERLGPNTLLSIGGEECFTILVEGETGDSYPSGSVIPGAEGDGSASGAKWKLEVAGKTDAEVFAGARTFTVRDWDVSFSSVKDEYDEERPTTTAVKTDIRKYTATNLYTLSKGDTAVISKGGETFIDFRLYAWSDPDGDGVYDGRLIGLFTGDILPVDTASPLHTGYGYGKDIEDPLGDLYDIGLVLELFSQELRVTEGVGAVGKGTEARLSADHLLDRLGPNTLLSVRTLEGEECFTILVEGDLSLSVPAGDWFTQKGLKFSPQNTPLRFMAPEPGEDELTEQVIFTANVKESTEDCQSGYKNVVFTFDRQDDSYGCCWTTAFDRHTGTLLGTFWNWFYASQDHEVISANIEVDGVPYNIQITPTGAGARSDYHGSIAVSCPIGYDGLVFQFGRLTGMMVEDTQSGSDFDWENPACSLDTFPEDYVTGEAQYFFHME